MKLSLALLFVFTLQVQAEGLAQKITIVKKKVSLSDVLKTIEAQSDYHFFYNRDLIAKAGTFSLTLKDVSVQEALEACLLHKQLSYSIVNNTIVIKSTGEELTTEFNINTTIEVPPIEIRGRVVDKNGLPLEGVSVTVSGSTRGTTTDKDGRFVITVNSEERARLTISFVGFKTQTVEAKDNLSITLEDAVEGLSDIVVVGYGTQKKSDLVGSVAQINAKKLMDKPAVNVGQGLQGKISGVQVVMQGGVCLVVIP